VSRLVRGCNNFAPTTRREKVEIARRIEAALARRVGISHDSNSQISDEAETGRSDHIAAKAVGWSR